MASVPPLIGHLLSIDPVRLSGPTGYLHLGHSDLLEVRLVACSPLAVLAADYRCSNRLFALVGHNRPRLLHDRLLRGDEILDSCQIQIGIIILDFYPD